MKLSTTTRYGLRALSDLCANGHDGPVTVSDIAKRQDIPFSYLEQLFTKLRRGDIVRSVRGAQGGYVMARPAGEISVSQVMEALGEPIAFGGCQTDEGCANAPSCPMFGVWRSVKERIGSVLDSTMLSDIAADMERLNDADDVEPDREEARKKAMRSTVQ